MITKTEVIDSINVDESNNINVRLSTVLSEDGVELSRTYHRHVLMVGDSLAGQDARVIAVATALWPTV